MAGLATGAIEQLIRYTQISNTQLLLALTKSGLQWTEWEHGARVKGKFVGEALSNKVEQVLRTRWGIGLAQEKTKDEPIDARAIMARVQAEKQATRPVLRVVGEGR